MGRADQLTAWAESSPEWAESVQVYTYGMIANQLRVPIYPVHISAAHTVETVKRLHAEGLNVVGETVACFLNTTAPEMDALGMGGKAKIQPPIRFEKDKERLWARTSGRHPVCRRNGQSDLLLVVQDRWRFLGLPCRH